MLQNGVDHVERITKLTPPSAEVLPVVVQLPAEKTAPGLVEQGHSGVLLVPRRRARTVLRIALRGSSYGGSRE